MNVLEELGATWDYFKYIKLLLAKEHLKSCVVIRVLIIFETKVTEGFTARILGNRAACLDFQMKAGHDIVERVSNEVNCFLDSVKGIRF